MTSLRLPVVHRIEKPINTGIPISFTLGSIDMETHQIYKITGHGNGVYIYIYIILKKNS